MRLMTFSAAATLLLAASLVIFWPGRNAAPGRAIAIAQPQAGGEAAPVGGGSDPSPPVKKSIQSPTDRIETELAKQTSVDFVEQPLKDVLLFLSDLHKIPIVLQKKKLEEAGVSPDAAITTNLRGVSLRSALNIILKEWELTYLVRDEVLQITTPEDAESQLDIRVYDCRDLLAMPAPPGADKFVPQAAGRALGGMFAVEDRIAQRATRGGGVGMPSGAGGLGGSAPAPQEKNADQPLTEHDLRATRLMEIIMTNVDSQSWDEVGGPGSISEYNGLIVVTQTAQTHTRVEHVFDMLREAAGLEVGRGTKVVR